MSMLDRLRSQVASAIKPATSPAQREARKFTTWESYFYPGTQTMVNRPGLLDPRALSQFEEHASRARVIEVLADPAPSGNFDLAHMQNLHSRLLGDTFPWAGQVRQSPTGWRMHKYGPSPEAIAAGNYRAPATHPYIYGEPGPGLVNHFEGWAAECRRRMHAVPPGHQMSPQEFAEAVAQPWGQMNLAHPFREGNTRSQMVFFTEMARTKGLELNIDALGNDPELAAKFRAGRFLVQHNGDHRLLAETIIEMTSVPGRQYQPWQQAQPTQQPNWPQQQTGHRLPPGSTRPSGPAPGALVAQQPAHRPHDQQHHQQRPGHLPAPRPGGPAGPGW